MVLTPCAPCDCIPGNTPNDTFKQNIQIILCGILAAVQASSPLVVGSFAADLAHTAGTRDLFTATGGDVLIKSVSWFVSVAAAGLTSVSSADNNTTPDTFLSATLLAALTAGKNLTPYTTLTYLPSGKKGQYTIVGTGTNGTLLANVEYYSLGGTLV